VANRRKRKETGAGAWPNGLRVTTAASTMII